MKDYIDIESTAPTAELALSKHQNQSFSLKKAPPGDEDYPQEASTSTCRKDDYENDEVIIPIPAKKAGLPLAPPFYYNFSSGERMRAVSEVRGFEAVLSGS